LRPIGQGRLVETQLIVEVRDDIIAALDHLARCLRETWLVPIDQWQIPCADDVKKETAEKKCRVCCGCRVYPAHAPTPAHAHARFWSIRRKSMSKSKSCNR